MAVRTSDILNVVNRIAPPELMEDYDNIGLLAGHPNRPVERVLVALDLTEAVVDEAVRMHAQLIVTHHPIFFRAVKQIREDEAEGAAVCALIRANLSLIAAHTNFDNAPLGVSDALADALELRERQTLAHGMRAGWLETPCAPHDFAAHVEKRLDTRVRIYAPGNKPLRKIAVLGGAGGCYYEEALRWGADAFVTGEVKHHEALAACASGLCVIEAGHYETERIAINLLANGLQTHFHTLQYNVSVVESGEVPFMR